MIYKRLLISTDKITVVVLLEYNKSVLKEHYNDLKIVTLIFHFLNKLLTKFQNPYVTLLQSLFFQ